MLLILCQSSLMLRPVMLAGRLCALDTIPSPAGILRAPGQSRRLLLRAVRFGLSRVPLRRAFSAGTRTSAVQIDGNSACHASFLINVAQAGWLLFCVNHADQRVS